MHIYMPGYGAAPTQEFTNTYLQTLAPFSTLRFVEWNKTISSTQVNWADRAQAGTFSWNGPSGVPYEDIIELANDTHKDAWINVPAGTTSDYINQLAQLVHTKLDPSLNVYVEYGNENWNNSFGEYNQVYAAALANPLVTHNGDVELAIAHRPPSWPRPTATSSRTCSGPIPGASGPSWPAGRPRSPGRKPSSTS